jgi:hypothetical protein
MTRRDPILLIAVTFATVSFASAADPQPADLEFFEKKIRPALAQYCFECHHPDKKVKGGLRLDTRDGWAAGGDSGPAVEPGKPDESLLLEVIRYDSDLKMPPKGKLPAEVIADFERWVKNGAADPRSDNNKRPKTAGIDIESGRKFWSYQPVKTPAVPAVKNENWPAGDIDRFILAALEANNLKPAAPADRAVLCRRVYYDLVGLPPTPEQVDAFVNDTSADAYERLVDGLLASPHFGERWGRHWLDVVRFAESITLRGTIYREAWRYRDYVVDTFNQGRPFDRFLVEQIAGDLLPGDSLAERRRNVIATTYLVLGNNNLEEQDKAQLRMDVVDEQLDTLGKGLLGQTIGCARCHDHKFDPIPTADYYALAGILRSTKTLEHANVSAWLDLPLPLPDEEELVYARHEKLVAELTARIKTEKNAIAKAKLKTATPEKPAVIATTDLPGIVVDDAQAKKVGEWKDSTYSGHYIGAGYIHDINEGKGSKSLTFLAELPAPGKYEVRLAYSHGTSRSDKVPVTVFSADGEKTIHVDEQAAPPIEGRFVSLGQYRFEKNGQAFVIISNEETKGHVTADVVQFIPVDQLAAREPSDGEKPEQSKKNKADSDRQADELKQLEAELKRLTADGPKRPMVHSIREESDIGDTQIHIRGTVHNLGATVPRGFLQVASTGSAAPAISDKESGRRELGEWIARADNPLTARVFVNRVWHWLFGAGIVRTTDNFGTTGELPSHPELLDHLASQFVQHNWSVKSLVRQIVLSQAYRQSSAGDPQAQKADPENRLLWKVNRRRMDAESLRDTLLSVSGTLDLTVGGPTIKPGTAADYGYQHAGTRRSLYQPVFRNALPEIFDIFDFADPSMVVGHRNVSTVAPQALFFMNNALVLEQARLSAKRLLAENHPDNAARLTRAYRWSLGREPTPRESAVALEYLQTTTADNPEPAWSRLFQALFATMDFRYID